MNKECECAEVKFTHNGHSSLQVELFGYDGIAFMDRREQEMLLKFLLKTLRIENEELQTVHERTIQRE